MFIVIYCQFIVGCCDRIVNPRPCCVYNDVVLMMSHVVSGTYDEVHAQGVFFTILPNVSKKLTEVS